MNQRDISFASFNLYNLQVAGQPMYNGKTYSPEDYQAKISWTAEKLALLDADVIAFQELWSAQALRQAFQVAGLSDAYQLVFIGDTAWYNVAVAAAVRKPWRVAAQTNHKQVPSELKLIKHELEEISDTAEDEDDDIAVSIDVFSRTILQLTLQRDGTPEVPPVTVYCCHLKSKLATRFNAIDHRRNPQIRGYQGPLGSALSTIRRTAEAAGLRILLDQQMADNHDPVVVIGDLNDGTLSNTLQIISRQPSYRLSIKSRSGRHSEKGLYAAAQIDQLKSFRDINYSHSYLGVPDIIDHVLVSDAFYDASSHRKWSFKDLRILTDHINPHIKAGEASDHGLVRAAFDWNPVED
jgi:endonuclease/exonuclease/phosphatase family metal-dependent hydrolase